MSVTAAFFVGIVDVLQAIGGYLKWNNPIIKFAEALNFNILGISLVILFAITWTAALIFWRVFDLKEKDAAVVAAEKEQEAAFEKVNVTESAVHVNQPNHQPGHEKSLG